MSSFELDEDEIKAGKRFRLFLIYCAIFFILIIIALAFNIIQQNDIDKQIEQVIFDDAVEEAAAL